MAVGIALLVGCGPQVVEEDDFVERQCEVWCDGLEPCEHHELSWSECFDDCVTSTWKDDCREKRATYQDCLLDLSCEELEDRTERVIAGQNSEELACYEESFASSFCRATR